MNREMVKGVMIGLGVGLLAPVMFPAVSRALRPTFNAALRAGVSAWERGRESLAEMGEYVEDMAAEVRAEHPAAPGGPAAAAERPEGGNA